MQILPHAHDKEINEKKNKQTNKQTNKQQQQQQQKKQNKTKQNKKKMILIVGGDFRLFWSPKLGTAITWVSNLYFYIKLYFNIQVIIAKMSR